MHKQEIEDIDKPSKIVLKRSIDPLEKRIGKLEVKFMKIHIANTRARMKDKIKPDNFFPIDITESFADSKMLVNKSKLI